MFGFCLIRAARAFLPLCLDWAEIKTQARRFAAWALPYSLLAAVMAMLLYASPYGPAIRGLYDLGTAGYWHGHITGWGAFRLICLVLPPWVLLTLLVVLPFSGGFRHKTILLYSLGGLLWWLVFSFCLTFTVDDHGRAVVIDGLKKGENFILWPSGRIQRRGVEVLGGSRALTDILKAVPEANIVLVRTSGSAQS